MTRNKTPKDLLITELSRKLFITEIEEKLLHVTYSLASDKLYTKDHALPELIRIIRLLDFELEAIMNDITCLEGILFDQDE